VGAGNHKVQKETNIGTPDPSTKKHNIQFSATEGGNAVVGLQ